MTKKNKEPKASKAEGTVAKKARKPRDPNKVQKPWTVRQLERLARVLKLSAFLQKRLAGAKVDTTNADAAIEHLQMLGEQLAATPDFAPKTRAPGNKPKVGDTISLTADASAAPIFKGNYGVTLEMFADATIVGDDRVYWIVKCTDGQVRAIAKKYTNKA
jgi:hypothetical protein